MFACSRDTVKMANPMSRNASCRVVTQRPSGVSRGVVLSTMPSPPSDAQPEAATISESTSISAVTVNPPSVPVPADPTLPAYAYLMTLMSGFCVIAFDVNAQDSVHLLQPLDTLVHTTVSQNIPFSFRADIADKVISDTPIHTGAAMIVAGLAVLAVSRPKKAASLAGLFAVFNFTCVLWWAMARIQHHRPAYTMQTPSDMHIIARDIDVTKYSRAVGGVGFGKDASATTAVKKFFARARPSDELHRSFSFPSGHSTSAYFILGFLFFVIVPALAAMSSNASKDSSPSESDPTSPLSGVQGILQTAAKPKVALALTIGCGMITQSGRLLADVHWVSDVLAGALWGSSGVALACVILEGLQSLTDRTESGRS